MILDDVDKLLTFAACGSHVSQRQVNESKISWSTITLQWLHEGAKEFLPLNLYTSFLKGQRPISFSKFMPKAFSEGQLHGSHGKVGGGTKEAMYNFEVVKP